VQGEQRGVAERGGVAPQVRQDVRAVGLEVLQQRREAVGVQAQAECPLRSRHRHDPRGTRMRMIFVNLPVRDVAASRAFFTALGFGWNEQFSGADTACMVVEENISVMLLSRERFADFVNGPIADAHASTEVLLCLSADSRDAVDTMVATAVAEGGKAWKPVMEHGPMYGHSFADLDGHVWEVMHMGASA
jgi:predicted lactoylglutathione lyase